MNISTDIAIAIHDQVVPAGSGVGVASFVMGTRIDVDSGAPGGGMAVTGTGSMVGSL